MNRLAKTAWHRKTSKPVTVWMAALVLISLVHWALPNYRWVLIHMFTLGIVTNSISPRNSCTVSCPRKPDRGSYGGLPF